MAVPSNAINRISEKGWVTAGIIPNRSADAPTETIRTVRRDAHEDSTPRPSRDTSENIARVARRTPTKPAESPRSVPSTGRYTESRSILDRMMRLT